MVGLYASRFGGWLVGSNLTTIDTGSLQTLDRLVLQSNQLQFARILLQSAFVIVVTFSDVWQESNRQNLRLGVSWLKHHHSLRTIFDALITYPTKAPRMDS